MAELRSHQALARAEEAAARIVSSLRAGGTVFFFGNGGSSMDAGHLAAELLGRFYLDRPALAAVSLPDATAALTAIGNDFSFDAVFARQLQGLARSGDVAVGLSTSGNSPNVVAGLRAARELGVCAVAMTGAGGGALREVADICIEVPTADTPRVQELCLHLGHTICEIVERELSG
ncbi:MAG: D-sedoheptulose-7-phosphate isomerase [Mycobacteriales bacterium]